MNEQQIKAHDFPAILVVEDEQGVRKITVKALRDYGYNTAEAITARQTMDIFKKEAS